MTIVHEGEPVFAPDKDAQNLRELNAVLAKTEGIPKLVAASGEELTLPHSVYDVLRVVVDNLAQDKGVRIMPVNAELTTQQAADLLNVSRPYLINLLRTEKIPYTMVGTHRRVRLEDLLVYQDSRETMRRKLLDQMAKEAQEEGFYDD